MAATQLTKEEGKAIGLVPPGQDRTVPMTTLIAIVQKYNEIILLLCECQDIEAPDYDTFKPDAPKK